jgi:hypothetical protein
MLSVGTQEGRDVSSTRQLVEPALFNRLEMTAPDTKALFNLRQAKATRFTLITQQTTDCATW